MRPNSFILDLCFQQLHSSNESMYNARDLQETWVQSLGKGDYLEKEMTTHSDIFAWEIP